MAIPMHSFLPVIVSGATSGCSLSSNVICLSIIQQRISGTCAAGSSIRVINADGSVTCQADTDTNTTYSAGSGLTLTGTTFAVSFAGTGAAISASRSDNGIVAWARITASGTLAAEFGVTSVAKTATGTYTVTLDAGAVDSLSLVPVAVAEVDSPPTSAAAARLVTVDQQNASPYTTFKVYITNGSFALTDNDFVFIVTGR